MTDHNRRDRSSFCSDCGAPSDSTALRPSRFGGDDVCPSCEATREREARLRGVAAVAVDPSTLAAMMGLR